jgi:hypothetical protein
LSFFAFLALFRSFPPLLLTFFFPAVQAYNSQENLVYTNGLNGGIPGILALHINIGQTPYHYLAFPSIFAFYTLDPNQFTPSFENAILNMFWATNGQLSPLVSVSRSSLCFFYPETISLAYPFFFSLKTGNIYMVWWNLISSELFSITVTSFNPATLVTSTLGSTPYFSSEYTADSISGSVFDEKQNVIYFMALGNNVGELFSFDILTNKIHSLQSFDQASPCKHHLLLISPEMEL